MYYYHAMSYPGEGKTNRLYTTGAMHQRFADLREFIAREKVSMTELSRQSRISAATWSTINNKKSLGLASYLAVGKFLHWDLRRDPNYIYAEVIFPPADLCRRVERLLPDNYNLYAGCRFIDHCLGFSTDTTWRCVNYAPGRDSLKFCHILQWIADGEYQWAYTDAIELEN